MNKNVGEETVEPIKAKHGLFTTLKRKFMLDWNQMLSNSKIVNNYDNAEDTGSKCDKFYFNCNLALCIQTITSIVKQCASHLCVK